MQEKIKLIERLFEGTVIVDGDQAKLHFQDLQPANLVGIYELLTDFPETIVKRSGTGVTVIFKGEAPTYQGEIKTEPSLFSATQRVKLFTGPDTGEQKAHYDPNNDWLNVLHDGSEMSLKRENWDALVSLVDRVTP